MEAEAHAAEIDADERVGRQRRPAAIAAAVAPAHPRRRPGVTGHPDPAFAVDVDPAAIVIGGPAPWLARRRRPTPSPRPYRPSGRSGTAPSRDPARRAARHTRNLASAPRCLPNSGRCRRSGNSRRRRRRRPPRRHPAAARPGHPRAAGRLLVVRRRRALVLLHGGLLVRGAARPGPGPAAPAGRAEAGDYTGREERGRSRRRKRPSRQRNWGNVFIGVRVKTTGRGRRFDIYYACTDCRVPRALIIF